MADESSNERKKIRNLVVCVGTGGVFYHGLSLMSNFLQQVGDAGVVLIDPDVVEEKNAVRQWGFGVGDPKVSCASFILSALGDFETRTYKEPIVEAEDLMTMVIKACLSFEGAGIEMATEKIIVIHAPDNHMCRMVVHEGCQVLQKSAKRPIIEITGGNTLVDGYAYGCRHEEDGKVVGDFLKRHSDIAVSAERERKLLEDPQSCGSMKSGSVVEQSSFSNVQTAYAVWSLLAEMFGCEYSGEVVWTTDKDGRIWIQRKEVL